MKFTFIGEPWADVVAKVEDAGYTYVAELTDADFLIHRGEEFDVLPPNIQWVQFHAAGINRVAHLIRKTDVPWTNAAGAFAEPVAEAALAHILSVMHQHKLAITAGSFDAYDEIDQRLQLLTNAGRTVVILGAGGIGAQLIRLLKVFGVHIIAVNRSGRAVEGADEVHTLHDMEQVWPRADILVNILPLTDETAGLIDDTVFQALPTTAIVINVGRGAVVDTRALVRALENGEIAGAGLDVTDPEPLPEDHRLWQLDNCLITPHTATTDEMGRNFIAPTIIANAAAFEEGRPMPTLIDIERGY
ncbi:D-isomer specific 2-hydroxyacid dehydrogenase family protein [Corynebacterium lubricantis]|uniref:D-isomer specific 2-hydroxyacid dehydrogenase family protein n=1 Tax=Corynebacterium lubricantis TaxID=541095 RepID=UPI000382732E|nr:D-isomer specific 2-hydroxyacid dehydrogenase family protein [Corynebacterium lubricantis]